MKLDFTVKQYGRRAEKYIHAFYRFDSLIDGDPGGYVIFIQPGLFINAEKRIDIKCNRIQAPP